MPPHDTNTLDELLAESRERANQFVLWLARLRAGDAAFAETSVLYPADMNEWRAATYLLTGCEQSGAPSNKTYSATARSRP